MSVLSNNWDFPCLSLKRLRYAIGRCYNAEKKQSPSYKRNQKDHRSRNLRDKKNKALLCVRLNKLVVSF